MSPWLRPVILIVVGLSVTGLLGWAGYEWLYKGTLVIEANSTASVSITDDQGRLIERNQTTRFFRLAPGDYRVEVVGEQAGTLQHVGIGSLSTKKVSLGDSKLEPVSLVVQTPLYGPVAYGNSILGYDPINERATRVDAAGDKSAALSSQELAGQGGAEPEPLVEISSYKPYLRHSFLAVSGQRLYVVGQGQLLELSVDGMNIPTDHEPSFVIATNPQQTSFLIACNRDVYLYQDVNAKPVKLYSAKKEFNHMAWGGDKLVLYSTDLPTSTQNLRGAYSDYQIDPLVVDTGTKQEWTLAGPLTAATLSPDGKLATIKPRGQRSYLYDVSGRRALGQVADSIAPPFWLDATTYLYERDKLVWRYNTSTRSGELVARLSATATSINHDQTTGFLVTTFNSLLTAGVYRIGGPAAAASPQISAAAKTLSEILPYATPDYQITFSNTTAPTIQIQTYAILNRESQLPQYRAQTQSLRQQAIDYLKSQGIDLNGITIIYNPADPL